ncbi:MAG: mechanosensitive ion channel family protein [Betaproteobacteria bacterium]|nr:mechanosensitive ion channel family protein [Betaproteobacteria bacterium]
MTELTHWFRELMNVPHWQAMAWTMGRVVLILVLGWVLHRLSRRLIRAFRHYMAKRSDGEEARRIETLARVFRYIAAVIIVIVAGTLVLGELGISIAPILATAGVAGVAIGFGAQSLIKDYFNGFFLLLEDQIRQGDVVQIAGQSGLVEEITLRHVRLRDFNGHVHFVPNGEITIVSNLTREYAQTVIEVGIAYREDPDEALAVMREVGQAMRDDPQFGPKIRDDTEIIGVERWDDSAVVLRCRLKVQPLEQWNVRREFLKRLKAAFDARGIEIPYPHLTLYPGQAKDGSAPALNVITRGK